METRAHTLLQEIRDLESAIEQARGRMDDPETAWAVEMLESSLRRRRAQLHERLDVGRTGDDVKVQF